MSKLAVGLMAALVASTSLVAASAQDRVLSGTGPASRAPLPCGAPLTAEAPDVMTYDRASGTQVFVSGKGGTEVSAFNRDTGSSAAMRGDLSRPGVTETCAVDRLSGDAYRVSSEGPGDMQVTGRTGETGERWAFRAPDGSTQYWDPRGDNRCFRQGLGLGANGGLGSGPRGDGRQGC